MAQDPAADIRRLLAEGRFDEAEHLLRQASVELLLRQTNGATNNSQVLMTAVALIRKRMGGDWTPVSAASAPRRKYRYLVDGGSPQVGFVAPEVEVVTMRILSATAPFRQYSVTPDGWVFTHPYDGYCREDERTYLAGLSSLLDDVAARFAEKRGGRGGRFLERNQRVWDADTKKVFGHITVQ
jgi:hypothetical protein